MRRSTVLSLPLQLVFPASALVLYLRVRGSIHNNLFSLYFTNLPNNLVFLPGEAFHYNITL
jgi:hypothetical protein